jgi:hypothetical protein
MFAFSHIQCLSILRIYFVENNTLFLAFEKESYITAGEDA